MLKILLMIIGATISSPGLQLRGTGADRSTLTEVRGQRLEALIVGSTMTYVGDRSPSGGIAVFDRSRNYRFLGSEPWAAAGPYRIERDEVRVDTSTPWSFKVYRSRSGKYFIAKSDQPDSELKEVNFEPFTQGERK